MLHILYFIVVSRVFAYVLCYVDFLLVVVIYLCFLFYLFEVIYLLCFLFVQPCFVYFVFPNIETNLDLDVT